MEMWNPLLKKSLSISIGQQQRLTQAGGLSECGAHKLRRLYPMKTAQHLDAETEMPKYRKE